MDELQTLDVVSHSAAQTQRLGAKLGELLTGGDLLLLDGELGAGKTCLTQGLAQGLGITSGVSSPTFTLVKEHCGRLPLYHMDLYRLDRPEEILDLGLEDYLERNGVVVVEWASRAESIWPEAYLKITFKFITETKRGVRFEASNARFQELLAAFKKHAFGL